MNWGKEEWKHYITDYVALSAVLSFVFLAIVVATLLVFITWCEAGRCRATFCMRACRAHANAFGCLLTGFRTIRTCELP